MTLVMLMNEHARYLGEYQFTNMSHCYGNSRAIQCYLPPGRSDIPIFTPANLGWYSI